MPEQETIDLTDGPNPIGTHLLRQYPEESYIRHLFGLGNRENLVEPDAVHDPKPAVEQGDPFPYRASLSAIASMGIPGLAREVREETARQERAAIDQAEAEARSAEIAAGRERIPTYDDIEAGRVPWPLPSGTTLRVVVDGLVSSTPTGSIDLQLRRQVEQ